MSNYDGPEWSQDEQDRLPVRAAGDDQLDSYIDQWLLCRAAREPLREAEDALEAMRDHVLDRILEIGPFIHNGRKLSVRPTMKVVVADWLKERVRLTGEDVAWTQTSESAPFFVMMPFGGWPRREHFIPDIDEGAPSEYIDYWLTLNQDTKYNAEEKLRSELSAEIKPMVVESGSFAYRDFMFLRQANKYVNPTPEAKADVENSVRRYMGLRWQAGNTLSCLKASK
jgi:hypothetical protein